MYTTEEFIKRAKEVHGDKYDYSKVNYIKSDIKVCIICPEHGEFWQQPAKHLHGCGCQECGKKSSAVKSGLSKKLSGGSRFIKLATKKHNGRFDYSKVKYVDYDTPVEIICPEHGSFFQTPKRHYVGTICCPKCVDEMVFVGYRSLDNEKFIKKAKELYGDKYDYSKVKYVDYRTKVTVTNSDGEDFEVSPEVFLTGRYKASKKGRKKTTEQFINEAKKIWGDTYDYSKTIYTGIGNKVTIICPVHGETEVSAENHLNPKKFSGCPKCNTEKQLDDMAKIKKPRKTKEERLEERRKQKENAFIEKARETHGDKYDYSKVFYESSSKKVCIICPTHGEFWQTPNAHASKKNHGGNCCPMCGKNGRRQKKYTQEEYVNLAMETFGGFYDYSKTVYRSMHKPVVITCPEHGDFEIRAFDHLHHKCGCPQHHKKSSLELRAEKMLKKYDVKYFYEKKFPWLGLQSLDFYLPDYNVAIEVQGKQHFFPVEAWGGKKIFELNKQRDSLKKELCEENGVDLYYYVDSGLMKYVDEVDKPRSFSNLEKLYEKIFSKSST